MTQATDPKICGGDHWTKRHALQGGTDDRAAEEVLGELITARNRFGPMASPHEALAVIEEEFIELRSAVFWGVDQRGRKSSPRAEAIQLAAMAIRMVADLYSDPE